MSVNGDDAIPLPNAAPSMQMCAPQPLPVTLNVQQVPGADGIMRVLLACSTPGGSGYYFLDAATALGLADLLRQAGSASGSNLLLP